MKLPEAFTRRMDGYFTGHPELSPEDFYSSFDGGLHYGIRINRLKVKPSDYPAVLAALPGDASPVPWCSEGYYVTETPSGKDPYYHAGVYYIQEPSAMLPAEVLGAQPGEKILDLCAAPGGKATRIGADLNGEGILIANEISEERSRALLRNIELFGIGNAVITNEKPEKLADSFPSYFDRILIDAPCSGEGMFRRDKNAVRSWERFGPSSCEVMQREILTSAHRMLVPGGHIVYSTCTFGTSENEDMIDWFLENFPEYDVVPHPEMKGVSFSRGEKFDGSMRIWPQISKGDGHFCVHLKKHDDAERFFAEPVKDKKRKIDTSKLYSTRTAAEALLAFYESILTANAFSSYKAIVDGRFLLNGDKIHLLPADISLFDGLKIVKMGAFPGEVVKTQKGWIMSPSHSQALMLSPEEMRPECVLTLRRDEDRLTRYLRGETILLEEDEASFLSPNSYILVTVDGYSIGWGKNGGASLKNLYPKAWRLQ
jgi:NOL1/NOP2/sun family putative RNA methylase